jgi:hypothetical protein
MEIDLDQVLRALSHPDRRLFLRACRDASCAAGELADLSNLAVATVSEHLKVLRTAATGSTGPTRPCSRRPGVASRISSRTEQRSEPP